MSDVMVKDGCMRPIKPMNGRCYTLLELQQLVGGIIELVDLGKKYLVLDEEGKLKGKMVNLIATGWLQQEGIHDFAVGTALLIDKKHLK